MELKYYLRGLGLGIVVTAIIMGIASSRGKAMTDDEIIARAKQLGMTENRVLTEAASEDADTGEDGAGNDVGNSGTDDDGEDTAPAQSDEMRSEEVTQPENEMQNTPESRNDASSDSNGTLAATDNTTVSGVPDDGETGQGVQTGQNAQNGQDTQAGQNAESGQGAQEAAAEHDEDGENAPEQAGETDQRAEEASGKSAVITVGSGDGSYTVSKKLEDAGAVGSASAFDTFLCENGYDKKIRAGHYTIPPNASNDQIARMITGQGAE